MDGALSHLRGLDALEWVSLLAVSASALCLLSLVALVTVRAGRRHWRRLQRHRKKRTAVRERE